MGGAGLGERGGVHLAEGVSQGLLTRGFETAGERVEVGCFFRYLTERTGAVPRVIVTDRLRSYGAAHLEVMPS